MTANDGGPGDGGRMRQLTYTMSVGARLPRWWWGASGRLVSGTDILIAGTSGVALSRSTWRVTFWFCRSPRLFAPWGIGDKRVYGEATVPAWFEAAARREVE